jgi:hypothetical protein
MTKEEKKKRCAGCRDDVYNHGCGGATECWSLADAQLTLRKEVRLDQVPPWNQSPRQFLSCYRKPGYVYMAPDRTC